MAYIYTVSYATAATGPWTQFGATVAVPTANVAGLGTGSNYWFEVFCTDTATGLSSGIASLGPIATSASLTESAQGFTVTAVGATPIYDTTLTAWSLVNSTSNGVQINHGGITDSANVTLLLFWNALVYFENASADWFYWNTTLSPPGYTAVAKDPRT